jgi:hypothetical protein
MCVCAAEKETENERKRVGELRVRESSRRKNCVVGTCGVGGAREVGVWLLEISFVFYYYYYSIPSQP